MNNVVMKQDSEQDEGGRGARETDAGREQLAGGLQGPGLSVGCGQVQGSCAVPSAGYGAAALDVAADFVGYTLDIFMNSICYTLDSVTH